MNGELDVAANSPMFVLGANTGATCLVTPTRFAYVMLQTKTGSAGWQYGTPMVIKGPTTLTASNVPANSALRVKFYGGVGTVDYSFTAVP